MNTKLILTLLFFMTNAATQAGETPPKQPAGNSTKPLVIAKAEAVGPNICELSFEDGTSRQVKCNSDNYQVSPKARGLQKL